MEGWLIFIGIIAAVLFISWLNDRLNNLRNKAKKYVALKPRLDDLDNKERQLEFRESTLKKELESRESALRRDLQLKENNLELQETRLKSRQIEWDKKVQSDIEAIQTLTEEKTEAVETLAKEKSVGFPWLAKAYNDYFLLYDSRLSDKIALKSHPAPKAAETLRQITKERREAEKAARLANYLLDYCRDLAPWLDEYIGLESAELDEIIKEIHSAWEKKEKEFDEGRGWPTSSGTVAALLRNGGRFAPERCPFYPGIRNLDADSGVRSELLNRDIFTTLTEAKGLIEKWRMDYNEWRLHASLGGLTPRGLLIMQGRL